MKKIYLKHEEKITEDSIFSSLIVKWKKQFKQQFFVSRYKEKRGVDSTHLICEMGGKLSKEKLKGNLFKNEENITEENIFC